MGAEIGSKENPYNSIFDAFRVFAPSSILLELEKPECRVFRRTNQYELIQMEDGTIGAFPDPMFMTMCYRGENAVYPDCEASIFRCNKNQDGTYDEDGIILDEIRIEEFTTILMTFPQVHFAIEDHCKVDCLALAQHYGLNTKLLDVTSAPEVAAYFATHQFKGSGAAVPIEKGIGCIRGLSPMMYMNTSSETERTGHFFSDLLHPIGLQCFERPGLQCAIGIEADKGEDFSTYGWRAYFKQTSQASNNIHANFHCSVENDRPRIMPQSWLFPKEEIARVASMVKRAKFISSETVERYCIKNGFAYQEIKNLMNLRGVKIAKYPVFVLPPHRIRQLSKEYAGRPYGDVRLSSRLCMLPPA